MSHDPHCRELADLFLADEPALASHAAALAEHIQAAIEDWIEAERPHVETREREGWTWRLVAGRHVWIKDAPNLTGTAG